MKNVFDKGVLDTLECYKKKRQKRNRKSVKQKKLCKKKHDTKISSIWRARRSPSILTNFVNLVGLDLGIRYKSATVAAGFSLGRHLSLSLSVAGVRDHETSATKHSVLVRSHDMSLVTQRITP